ncbi:hypothetical protein BYT27DRAFT_7108977 [Phlegmacium glaucopus]|nr:hypothetical protein BYT27DRAFT_7108977 [Phlegmacium glaucopus]
MFISFSASRSIFIFISSVYTWNPASPPDLFGLEFIPMLWGYSQISDFQRLVVPGYATHVLGFNEPDLNTQSGIDAWTAASLWQQYIQPLKNHGYTLVSPATTSAPSGKKWMQDFISACHGCTIDVVALHWYGTNAQAFIAYVTDFHTTFNRNIWVTEFACQDFAGGPQADQDQVFAFMKTVTSWMDSTSFVEKYFAFGVMTDMGNVSPLNQLMNPDGTPTPLGWTYIG